MTVDRNLTILARIRRFQRFLLFGGGLLCTLIAIFLLAWGVNATLEASLQAKRRAFATSYDFVQHFGRQGVIAPERLSGRQGLAVLVDRQGDTDARQGDCVSHACPLTQKTITRLAASAGGQVKEERADGLLLLYRRLPDSRVLIHAYSPHGLSATASGNVVIDLMLTLPTLAMMWLLLLSLKLRVFRPLLEWSRRVYEGDRLSRALIDTAPVGLGVIATDNGKVLMRSPVMAELARRIAPAEETLAERCLQQYASHVSSGDASWRHGVFNQDFRFDTHDHNGLELSVSMVRARYQGKSVLVTAFTDVTAKTRVEQQLRKARQAAISANAAKSAFLAAMSHEIRTPMNAILGNLELLSQSSLTPEQSERLRTIWDSSEGLLAVVNDVLDFSKIEAGELRLERIEFDAVGVLGQAMRLFLPAARAKSLCMTGWFGEAVELPMAGDPTRLGQIINNLLSNAIKFTPAGEVDLCLALEQEAGWITIEVRDTGIGMSAEQMSRLFRPFSQGDVTVNRRFGGTGLGLALSHRLAQAMGGALSVRSVAGQGSVFTLRLPLEEAPGAPQMPHFDGQHVLVLSACPTASLRLEAALRAWGLRPQMCADPGLLDPHAIQAASAVVLWADTANWPPEHENRVIELSHWVIDCAADGPCDPLVMGRVLKTSSIGLGGLAASLGHALLGAPLNGSGLKRAYFERALRILVVEDDAMSRTLLEDQLRMLGCEPVCVEDGSRALACLEGAAFDILLTDLTMPGLDGYTVAEHASARWPDMPIIAASAHVASQERARCRLAGVAVVLSKPLAQTQLAQAISEVTGERIRYLHVRAGAAAGDIAAAKDWEGLYAKACQTSLARLRLARQGGDVIVLLAELHTLRGMLSIFGENKLGRVVCQVEAYLKAEGGLAVSGSLLDSIEEQLEGAADGGADGSRNGQTPRAPG